MGDLRIREHVNRQRIERLFAEMLQISAADANDHFDPGVKEERNAQIRNLRSILTEDDS